MANFYLILVFALFTNSCRNSSEDSSTEESIATVQENDTESTQGKEPPSESKMNKSDSSEEEVSNSEVEISIESGSSDEKEESESDLEQDSGSVSLRIAAFNAETLGKTKIGKEDISGYIADIITNFDVILIQEVRDKSLETPLLLLQKVNAKNKGVYSFIASERLGRTSYKEQYVYYYKTGNGIQVDSEYVYGDSSDIFEREPYIVRLSMNQQSLVLIGIHVKPSDAITELNALDNVHAEVKLQFPDAMDWVILGDLNADCSYVSNGAYEELDLVKDTTFKWHIPKDQDTTTSDTDCAYDNVISTSAVANGNIFDFVSILGLSAQTALDVSNHFPVYFIHEL